MEAVTNNMASVPECKIPEGDDTRRRSALSSHRNQIHPDKRMMKSVARHLRPAGNGILLGVAVNKTPRKEESSYERE